MKLDLRAVLLCTATSAFFFSAGCGTTSTGALDAVTPDSSAAPMEVLAPEVSTADSTPNNPAPDVVVVAMDAMVEDVVAQDSSMQDSSMQAPDTMMPPRDSATQPDVMPLPSGAMRFGPMPIDCVHRGNGRDIQVGNPRTESGTNILQVQTVGEVDWNNLRAGDTVRIFYRAEPYREKILLRARGTAAQPVRVCGVRGPGGELPIIDGNNATTRRDLDYGGVDNLMQDLGVLSVWDRSYERRAEYIVIEGLHLRGTMAEPGNPGNENEYTATDGTRRRYRSSAACLRIQEAAHVVLRGNELEGCGNGLFVLSRVPEVQMTRDVLIEGNYLHGNGVGTAAGEGIHSAYVQGVDITIQFNRFGENRPSARGNNLKVRVAGDVIRYNYFENGARVLDLVEVEDHAELVLPWQFENARRNNPTEFTAADEPRVQAAWNAYQRTYAYGNILLNRGPRGSTNLVHYSFDNTQDDRRPGRLFFYFNTVVAQSDASARTIVRLVDQGPWWGNSGPALRENSEASYATVVAVDNAIVTIPLTEGARRSYWEFTRYRADRLSLGVNWITRGWDAAIPGYNQMFPGYGNALVDNPAYVYAGGNDRHHVTGAMALLTGDEVPVDLRSYRPTTASALRDRAAALPSEIPAEHIPRFQIDPSTGAITERATVRTIGAVE